MTGVQWDWQICVSNKEAEKEIRITAQGADRRYRQEKKAERRRERSRD